ncbi:hypothetical protein RJD24_06340 [Bacillaceae bacterium IKA-2]|nr:hypothetical protein RJD24_06340 [Bacillaceae bacterium IKA-2]
MNLMDVLLFQNQTELVKLLRDTQSSYNKHSKREMIEVLYPLLLNKENVSERFQQLTSAAKRIVLTICYDDKLFLAREELYGIVPKVDNLAFLQLVKELTTSGLLFVYLNKNYLIPSQIKKELIKCFQQKINENSLILPANNQINNQLYMVNDLFSFIDIIEEQALPLTKNGLLYKKDFQQIIKQFHRNEPLPSDQWRFGYGRRFSNYPDRFSLIYDYCFYRDWITEEDGNLAIGPKANELHDSRLTECMNGLVRYWLKLYRRPVPAIRLLYKITLDSLKEGEGLEQEFIIAELTPFVDEYYFDSKEDVIRKRFLNMLCSLDIIKMIEDDSFHGITVGPAKAFLTDL